MDNYHTAYEPKNYAEILNKRLSNIDSNIYDLKLFLEQQQEFNKQLISALKEATQLNKELNQRLDILKPINN